MALKAPSDMDKKLNKIYQDKITINQSENYIDRSDILLEQMNFIAINNRNFLNLRWHTQTNPYLPYIPFPLSLPKRVPEIKFRLFFADFGKSAVWL